MGWGDQIAPSPSSSLPDPSSWPPLSCAASLSAGGSLPSILVAVSWWEDNMSEDMRARFLSGSVGVPGSPSSFLDEEGGELSKKEREVSVHELCV